MPAVLCVAGIFNECGKKSRSILSTGRLLRARKGTRTIPLPDGGRSSHGKMVALLASLPEWRPACSDPNVGRLRVPAPSFRAHEISQFVQIGSTTPQFLY